MDLRKLSVLFPSGKADDTASAVLSRIWRRRLQPNLDALQLQHPQLSLNQGPTIVLNWENRSFSIHGFPVEFAHGLA